MGPFNLRRLFPDTMCAGWWRCLLTEISLIQKHIVISHHRKCRLTLNDFTLEVQQTLSPALSLLILPRGQWDVSGTCSRSFRDSMTLSTELGYHRNPHISGHYAPGSKGKSSPPENHLSPAAIQYNSTTLKQQSEDKAQTKLDLTA